MKKYYINLSGREVDPDSGRCFGEFLLFETLWNIEADSAKEAKLKGEEYCREHYPEGGDVKIKQIEVREQLF